MIYKRTALNRNAGFSTREEDGNLHISGYFSVFGARYDLGFNGAYETVEKGAFNLSRDKDIRALINHDTTLVLGRTTAGTLDLRVDENGLYGDITINQDDQDAMNLYARVKRGDVSQCSFGFDIIKQEEIRENGVLSWHLTDVKLYEVSVCTFPAYEETGVKAREKDFKEMQEREAAALKQRLREKLQGVKHA